MQQNQNIPVAHILACGNGVTLNAAGIRANGAEAQTDAQVTRSLSVSLGLSYTDSQFTADLPLRMLSHTMMSGSWVRNQPNIRGRQFGAGRLYGMNPNSAIFIGRSKNAPASGQY